MNFQELISQLEALRGMLNTSISTISNEASNTSAQITLLQNAIQGMDTSLGERLTQLKSTYTQITQQLEGHKQFVGNVETGINQLITQLKSMG